MGAGGFSLSGYTSKQFMDMVGVKFSTLRHYERIGLLDPRKDSSNNFRLYTPRDAFRLNKFRKLRAIGFSSKEALGLMENPDQENLDEKLSHHEEVLETELTMAQARLGKLKEMRQHLSGTREGKFHFDHMKDTWFLPSSDGYSFGISKYEIVSRWVELLPLTVYCQRLQFEDLHLNKETDFGMTLEDRHSKLLKDKWKKTAQLIPGGPCLLYYSRNLGYPEISVDMINKANEYIKSEGYRVRDIILLEGIDLNYGNEACHKVTIPVVKLP